MIMYRNGIPLVSAEELGYNMGLVVPPEEKHLFYDVRVSETPPSGAGFGTQIHLPEYDLNTVFEQLAVPLKYTLRSGNDISDETELLNLLKEVETKDGDALLCLNHGVLKGKFEPNTGHVVVFDRIVDGMVRVINPSFKQPKWQTFEVRVIFEAIQSHVEHSGGIWYFDRI